MIQKVGAGYFHAIRKHLTDQTAFGPAAIEAMS
jgi:hypothetical protein